MIDQVGHFGVSRGLKFESYVERVALAGGLGSRVNAIPSQGSQGRFTAKVYTERGMLDTVSGAEGEGAERRYAAGAARSSRGRGKSEDRAMTSWFLVGPRYSPRVSRYLRRRLSNATRLKRAASSRGMDDPPRERTKGRLWRISLSHPPHLSPGCTE